MVRRPNTGIRLGEALRQGMNPGNTKLTPKKVKSGIKKQSKAVVPIEAQVRGGAQSAFTVLPILGKGLEIAGKLAPYKELLSNNPNKSPVATVDSDPGTDPYAAPEPDPVRTPTDTDTEDRPLNPPVLYDTQNDDDTRQEETMVNRSRGSFNNSGRRSGSRGSNRSSQSRGNSGNNSRQSDTRQNSVFGIAAASPPTSFNSKVSKVWWSNPVTPQTHTVDENSSRTAFTIIRCGFDASDATGVNYDITKPQILDLNPTGSKPTEGAYMRYYSDVKREIVSNTNATPTAANILWLENFHLYQQISLALVAALAELEARMHWSPEFEESNLIHRDIVNLTAGDTELLKSRNRAYDALSLLAVPTEMIEYYRWLFQVYKKSDIIGGCTHTFMSAEMCRDLNDYQNTGASNFTFTKGKLDWLSSATFNYNNQKAHQGNPVVNGSFSQITALLTDKCDYPFTIYRQVIGAAKDPVYHKMMNAIIDNFIVWTNNNQATESDLIMYPKDQNSPIVGLPFEADSVPCAVGAHLLPNFTQTFDDANGFPLFKTGKPDFVQGNSAQILAFENPGVPQGFTFDFRRGNGLQITDHIFTYNSYMYQNGATASGSLVTRGDNVRRFQLGSENAVLDCVQMFNGLIGVTSGY
jgi:hypothetical protein